MKLVVKRSTLLEDTYREGNRKEFEEKIKEYITLLSNLTTVDLASLPDNEYYELLNRFYNITFEKEDYLIAFSRYFKNNYTRYETLNTDMIQVEAIKDGFGNSVTWNVKKQKISIEAAVSNGIKINPNKEYTKDEIISMVKNKEIIPTETKKTEVSKATEVKENYINIITIAKRNFFKKNISIFGSMLKDAVTKEKINSDLLKFLKELNYQLGTLTIYNQGDYYNLNNECKIWWNASKEKEEYDCINDRVSKR